MSAQDLEQRARELLAAEYEREGSYQAAGKLRDQSLPMMWWSDELALRAIAAALRHQPAPVVDDAMRELIEAAKRVCAAWNSGNPPELKRIGEREYHSPAGSMLDATEIAPLYAALARAQGVQS